MKYNISNIYIQYEVEELHKNEVKLKEERKHKKTEQKQKQKQNKTKQRKETKKRKDEKRQIYFTCVHKTNKPSR